MKHAIGKGLAILIILSLCLPFFSLEPVTADNHVVQTAVISEEYGYLNLSTRGGQPTGPGVDGDGRRPCSRPP
jgi:hypothetical protein